MTTLTDESEQLFAQFCEVYDLREIEEAAERVTLRQALAAMDRADSAQTQIDRQGQTVEDRFGASQPHPLLRVEQSAREQFFAAMARLNLSFRLEPLAQLMRGRTDDNPERDCPDAGA